MCLTTLVDHKFYNLIILLMEQHKLTRLGELENIVAESPLLHHIIHAASI